MSKPGTPAWTALVEKCGADLAKEGIFNLEGLIKPGALTRAVAELQPVLDTLSFAHKRLHNIYFKKEAPGLTAASAPRRR
ncbi:MAG: hypothetical protein Q8L53_13725 [Aestuariivirga sp.]|nr:hypothetical protein [Aestuariivirga sp.]